MVFLIYDLNLYYNIHRKTFVIFKFIFYVFLGKNCGVYVLNLFELYFWN